MARKHYTVCHRLYPRFMTDAEEYEKERAQLKALLAKRKEINKELDDVEEKLYLEESAYLQDASAGNVIKGFEHYTKNSQNRRRYTVTENDRIFSQSSVLFMEATE